MRIPLEINAEWSSLGKTDDPAANLASIAVIRSWLDEAAAALQHGKGSAREPRIYGHAKSSVEGVTHPDFDGVESQTLRYWKDWWSDPKRSATGREEAGRDPKMEAERIRDELRARPRRLGRNMAAYDDDALPRPIPDAQLCLVDLPRRDASEGEIQRFALTKSGYDDAGGFEAVAAIANTALERWNVTGQLPDSLHELRLCLFFEQRRWRHFGDPMDDSTLRYALALIDAMRELVPA